MSRINIVSGLGGIGWYSVLRCSFLLPWTPGDAFIGSYLALLRSLSEESPVFASYTSIGGGDDIRNGGSD